MKSLVVVIDENSDECLYVDGKAWRSRVESTVYACDIFEYAEGVPITFEHRHVESVEHWPDSLDELTAID